MDDYISKPIEQDKLKSILHYYFPGETIEKKTMIVNKENDRNNTIFDQAHLNEFTDGNKDLEKKILDVFLDNLKIDITEIERAHANNNYKLWDESVHKLYGGCLHVGAKGLAHACDQAQSINEDDNIESYHRTIMGEYQKLITVISKQIYRVFWRVPHARLGVPEHRI